MSRIVDTSVVVKWAVRENGWEAAAALIGTDVIAPDLVQAELANALWKKVLREEISAEQAFAAQSFIEATLEFVPVLALSNRALEIGLALRHPVYDCFFLALAELHSTKLITADQRLAKRCEGTPYSMLLQVL